MVSTQYVTKYSIEAGSKFTNNSNLGRLKGIDRFSLGRTDELEEYRDESKDLTLDRASQRRDKSIETKSIYSHKITDRGEFYAPIKEFTFENKDSGDTSSGSGSHGYRNLPDIPLTIQPKQGITTMHLKFTSPSKTPLKITKSVISESENLTVQLNSQSKDTGSQLLLQE